MVAFGGDDARNSTQRHSARRRIMRVSRSYVWASTFSLALGVLSGCYVEARTAPAEYVASPPPPPPSNEVVVENPPPPPPPQAEVAPPPPPNSDTIWIGGNYRWIGQRYEWQRGHYERRPRVNARYSNGHWEQRARGKVWVEGRWE
jgi:hypothetical protein